MFIQYAHDYFMDPSAHKHQFVLFVNSWSGADILEYYPRWEEIPNEWLTVEGKRVPPDQVGDHWLSWAVDDRYFKDLKDPDCVRLTLSSGMPKVSMGRLFGRQCNEIAEGLVRCELDMVLSLSSPRVIFPQYDYIRLGMPWYRANYRAPVTHKSYQEWVGEPWNHPSREAVNGTFQCLRCGEQALIEKVYAVCPSCMLSFEPQKAKIPVRGNVWQSLVQDRYG